MPLKGRDVGVWLTRGVLLTSMLTVSDRCDATVVEMVTHAVSAVECRQ